MAALLATAPVAHAQTAAGRAERADPLDARAPVPAVGYTSALSGYRRLGDDKRVSWKDANDTVTRIGGWRVYTREAQMPDPAASSPTGSPPGPAPAQGIGHGHHKTR